MNEATLPPAVITGTTSRPPHYAYIDLLRVISAFAVVLLHTSASPLVMITNFHPDWQSIGLAMCNTFARFAVPVFLMISGAMNISERELPLKNLFRSKIGKFFIVWLFWSSLYALLYVGRSGSISLICTRILNGHFHLWYLYVLTGLYLSLPFLKLILPHRKLLLYLLVLTLVFSNLRLTLAMLPLPGCRIISNFLDSIRFVPFSNYIGLFLLGYYLHNYQLPRRWLRVIYIASFFAFGVTMLLTIYCSAGGEYNTDYQPFYQPGIVLMAMGVFLWCKNGINPENKFLNGKFFRAVAAATLGVYLLHPLVLLNIVTWTDRYPQLPQVPLTLAIALAAFAICTAVITLMRHLPLLKKTV